MMPTKTGSVLFLGLMVSSWAFAEIVFHERPLPKRYNECHLCHLKKEKKFMPSAKHPQKEHFDYPLIHGKKEISCHSCHDINNSNYLRSSVSNQASFANTSPVCQQCHAEQYRKWKKNIHGKWGGEWKGVQIQYHCIDCHDPHSVTFKKMKAVSPPKKPKYQIGHTEGGHSP